MRVVGRTLGGGSSVVLPGEIPVYLQPMVGSVDGVTAHCCCCWEVLQEPAHFNWNKPLKLSSRVSDDHWASLKLRVDPLARKILDPTRSLLVAAFLIFLMWQVFRAIKPNPHALYLEYYYNSNNDAAALYYILQDDDNVRRYNRLLGGATEENSNNYNNNSGGQQRQQQQHQQEDQEQQHQREEEHQQQLQNYRQQQFEIYIMRKEQMDHALVYWNLGFFSFAFGLMMITSYLSKSMMDNNACVDELIRNILKEIRQRFQLDCGLDISYRTNQRDTRRNYYSQSSSTPVSSPSSYVDDSYFNDNIEQELPSHSLLSNTRSINVVLLNSLLNIIFRPQRVIVFTDITGDKFSSSTSNSIVGRKSSLEGPITPTRALFFHDDASTTAAATTASTVDSCYSSNNNTNFSPSLQWNNTYYNPPTIA